MRENTKRWPLPLLVGVPSPPHHIACLVVEEDQLEEEKEKAINEVDKSGEEQSERIPSIDHSSFY